MEGIDKQRSVASVLVVDDSVFVARLITKMLEESDYRVIGHAKNGLEAIDMYGRLKPDLITMDIVMPSMGGIETINELLAIDAQARILVVSAMGHENIVNQALQLGARHYILKPFKKEDFVSAVQLVLASAAGTRS
jgi:two-component system chemotaxis response regulator CheY